MMYIRFIIFTILSLHNIVLAANGDSFFEAMNSKLPSNYIYNIVKDDIDITLKDHIISFDEFKQAREESYNNWDNGILDESKRPKTTFNFFNIYFKRITSHNREKYDFSDLLIDALDLNNAVLIKRHNGIIDSMKYTNFLTMNLSLNREKRNKYYNISESKNLFRKTFITFSPGLISAYNKFIKYTFLFFSFIFDFDLGKMVKKYSLNEKRIKENQFIDTDYTHQCIPKSK